MSRGFCCSRWKGKTICNHHSRMSLPLQRVAMDQDDLDYNSKIEAFRTTEYPMLKGRNIQTHYGVSTYMELQMPSISTMREQLYVQSHSWRDSWLT